MNKPTLSSKFELVGVKNQVAGTFVCYFGSDAKYHKKLAEEIVKLLSSHHKELLSHIEGEYGRLHAILAGPKLPIDTKKKYFWYTTDEGHSEFLSILKK